MLIYNLCESVSKPYSSLRHNFHNDEDRTLYLNNVLILSMLNKAVMMMMITNITEVIWSLNVTGRFYIIKATSL